jgi:hypothetical protein
MDAIAHEANIYDFQHKFKGFTAFYIAVAFLNEWVLKYRPGFGKVFFERRGQCSKGLQRHSWLI